MNILSLKKEIRALGNTEKAAKSMRFFKTGKDQYGEGDIFLGLTVPEQRIIAQKYGNLSLELIEELLQSKEHEFRLTALMILTRQYAKGDKGTQKKILDLYLANTKWINNWDLVDASAHYILGEYLLHYKTPTQALALLTKLARSKNLWERRIAMVSTWAFIKAKNPEPTFVIGALLLNDTEDLMHKAVGWMLREAGKHSGQKTLRQFLDTHVKNMPRTALRYSLEHFEKKLRKQYMKR